MARYSLLVDYKYCTGCLSCEVACNQEYGRPLGHAGIKSLRIYNEAWRQIPYKLYACSNGSVQLLQPAESRKARNLPAYSIACQDVWK